MTSSVFFQFAAGKIYDDIGEHAAAFSHCRPGNDLSQETWKEAEFGKTCEGIWSVFTEDFLTQRAGAGIADSSPFFIVGMSRSGSSLVEQTLAGHRQVFGAGELHDIAAIVADMGRRMTPTLPAICALSAGPGIFLHVGIIRLLFPRAKIIHSRRHPLDTCLSCYF